MKKGYSIYKRGGPRAKGPHIIAYYEVAGDPTTRRTVRGCFSKTDTEAMARKLADEARLRALGLNDPKVEQYAAAEARPLKEHLGDFPNGSRASSARPATSRPSRRACPGSSTGAGRDAFTS